jgi:hypothetical protein
MMVCVAVQGCICFSDGAAMAAVQTTWLALEAPAISLELFSLTGSLVQDNLGVLS